MPYIADYLWQDVLAAVKVVRKNADEEAVFVYDLTADIEELERAVEAAEGGSSDT